MKRTLTTWLPIAVSGIAHHELLGGVDTFRSDLAWALAVCAGIWFCHRKLHADA